MRERLIEAGFSEEMADLAIEIVEGGDSGELIGEVERLKKEVEEYRLKLRNFEKEKILDDILRAAGAKNLKAVKGVLDLDKAFGLEEEGIKAMVKELTNGEDTGFLFESEEERKRKGLRGVRLAGQGKKAKEKDKKDFRYEDWAEYYRK